MKSVGNKFPAVHTIGLNATNMSSNYAKFYWHFHRELAHPTAPSGSYIHT